MGSYEPSKGGRISKSSSRDDIASLDTSLPPSDVREKLTRIIVHVADIGAQTTTHTIAKNWMYRCYAEFRHQAEMESTLGIMTSPFLHDLKEEDKIYASQYGFINDIVQPIWTNLVKLVPNLSFALENLIKNKEEYQRNIHIAASNGECGSNGSATTSTSTSTSS